jgi:serine/threonine-protein kinase
LAEGTEFAGCRVEGVVGRGGMGVVYRATQLGLGRPVALKVLATDRAADPEFRARFQREWQMAAAIDHPNVIPVYAAGEEDGTLYLVLRFVDGIDLHELLRRDGPLPPARAAAIVEQVASALDAAHAAGLVHRDVKPGNVLLDREHVYLSDFGLTRPAAATTSLTETGRWLGTVDYASPEQLEGGKTDARSDVYALGCVLYAALTGGPPFARDTMPRTLLAHLTDQPPKPSEHGTPEAFDRVITRALAKDPASRYPSAGDLGRAALAAARGEPVTEGERSVARGAAAPVPRNGGGPRTAVTRHAGEATAATRVGPAQATRAVPAPPTAAAPPPRPRPAAVRVRGRARGVLAALLALIAAATAGLLAAALLGDGGERPPTGPVSEEEVRSVVERFGRAFAAEDGAALGRTLTRDAERVLPGGRQRGRAQVVAEYRAQFRGTAVAGYELEDLDVRGGDVGRAEGRYVVTRRGAGPFGGSIVFTVVRERGRPRIDLIAARPEA